MNCSQIDSSSSVMKKRLFTFSIIFALVLLLTGKAFCESHMTCPVEASEEEMFQQNDVVTEVVTGESGKAKQITVIGSETKVWGPAPKVKSADVSTTEAKAEKSRYPAISVRYKTYVTKPGKASGKYSKHLSSRGGRYMVQYVNITPIIIREAKKNKISPLLLKAVIETESGFNNYARGPSGAMGLCQLMPGTARNMGVRDPYNPEQNIRGGAKLLGMLIRQFGSVEKGLAAYNLGGGAVSRHGGVPSCAWSFIGYVKKRMKW